MAGSGKRSFVGRDRETVIVAPRHMGVARIRGAAATLPCSKPKKK